MDDDKKYKTGRLRYFCLVGMVAALLAGCSVWIHLTPDRSYSAEERRMLTERPKASLKSVMRGKFQKKYETYLSEQFPGRAQMVTLRTKWLRLLGERDANGVYFGREDYLLERYRVQDFNWKHVRRNLRQTAAFLEAYPNARVLFVPVKSSVLSDKLPMFAQTGGESRFFELAEKKIPKEQSISVADLLKSHNDEYIYYRTDHHWTTLGAYYGYEAWAESMGFVPIAKDQFTVETVSSTFLGTTYAKVRTGGKADEISLYERNDGPEFVVDYNMGEFQSDSFYDRSMLEGDDPYSVFFGGNQALVDIRSLPEQKNGRTLLILKDSFGNCFAPFAANHYARTVVVDLRQVNISVSKLMRAYPADDILILYNSAQFMDDRQLDKLK